MTKSSRLPGFHKLPMDERRARLGAATGTDGTELEVALEDGGLDVSVADKFVENVVGTYALPFAVALNVALDGEDVVVPMVVEEPSVVAAASNAAKMARAGGGFTSDVDEPVMIAQIQLTGIADPVTAQAALLAAEAELLAKSDGAVPGLVGRGGGARGIEARILGDGSVVLHLLVDCRDAMGANLVNTVAEAVAPFAAELTGGQVGLRILSNLSDRRCVRVTCRVPFAELTTALMDGEAVAKGVEAASRFAENDPYRAATHNKGIMNGIDPVVIATGNDWRAVEAGAHAFAARSGRYSPLATWRVEGDVLVGRLEIPMALGTVGGTLRVHPTARLALRLLGQPGAVKLAAVAAAVGLASNLAALRALATDGIQRGHMRLHARSVAVAAGASLDDVDLVATMMVEAREITVEGARRALAVLGRTAQASSPSASAGASVAAEAVRT